MDRVVCRFYAKKFCKDGDKCLLPHVRDNTRVPDNVCRFFLKGKCHFDSACHYDHTYIPNRKRTLEKRTSCVPPKEPKVVPESSSEVSEQGDSPIYEGSTKTRRRVPVKHSSVSDSGYPAADASGSIPMEGSATISIEKVRTDCMHEKAGCKSELLWRYATIDITSSSSYFSNIATEHVVSDINAENVASANVDATKLLPDEKLVPNTSSKVDNGQTKKFDHSTNKPLSPNASLKINPSSSDNTKSSIQSSENLGVRPKVLPNAPKAHPTDTIPSELIVPPGLSVSSFTNHKSPDFLNNPPSELDPTGRQMYQYPCPVAMRKASEPSHPEYIRSEVKPDYESTVRFKNCGLCKQRIYVADGNLRTSSRYWIMENCDHVLCDKCYSWVRNACHTPRVYPYPDSYLPCSQCNTPLNLIIPTCSWVSTPEEKKVLMEDYKEDMARIPCQYFNHGLAQCPFGALCVYRHEMLDGTRVILPFFEFPIQFQY